MCEWGVEEEEVGRQRTPHCHTHTTPLSDLTPINSHLLRLLGPAESSPPNAPHSVPVVAAAPDDREAARLPKVVGLGLAVAGRVAAVAGRDHGLLFAARGRDAKGAGG